MVMTMRHQLHRPFACGIRRQRTIRGSVFLKRHRRDRTINGSRTCQNAPRLAREPRSIQKIEGSLDIDLTVDQRMFDAVADRCHRRQMRNGVRTVLLHQLAHKRAVSKITFNEGKRWMSLDVDEMKFLQ